jgi:hypothetical protein
VLVVLVGRIGRVLVGGIRGYRGEGRGVGWIEIGVGG